MLHKKSSENRRLLADRTLESKIAFFGFGALELVVIIRDHHDYWFPLCWSKLFLAHMCSKLFKLASQPAITKSKLKERIASFVLNKIDMGFWI